MIRVITFGYLHGEPPRADVTYDLRRYRDPAMVRERPELLDSNGTNPDVREYVINTDGIPLVLKLACEYARELAKITDKDITLAFGCAGGKHRAASVGILLTAALIDFTPELTHRDMHRPRVIK